MGGPKLIQNGTVKVSRGQFDERGPRNAENDDRKDEGRWGKLWKVD